MGRPAGGAVVRITLSCLSNARVFTSLPHSSSILYIIRCYISVMVYNSMQSHLRCSQCYGTSKFKRKNWQAGRQIESHFNLQLIWKPHFLPIIIHSIGHLVNYLISVSPLGFTLYYNTLFSSCTAYTKHSVTIFICFKHSCNGLCSGNNYDNSMCLYLYNLPHKVKMQYLHFRSHTDYFLLSWKIPEVISRRSVLFHNKRQYLPYQTYAHTPF